ncbi:MAG: HAD-IA family hydrolase [Sterolibacterium sp.]|jgi:putative hydrolase of the HAD superfamily
MPSPSIYTPPAGLLLDFGSVITWSLFEKHRDTEATLGLPPGTLTWLGPLDPAGDELWQAMQRDEIGERDYWAQRAAQVGRACGEDGWDMHALLKRIRHTDPNAAVRPQILQLVRRVSGPGIKVGILSNELELFYGQAFLDRLDIMREIAVVIDGSHSQILKPDPRAYRAAAEGMGLAAARLLFVDDQMRNILGAHACGLQTQFFDLRDPDGCCRAIESRLRLGATEVHPTETKP